MLGKGLFYHPISDISEKGKKLIRKEYIYKGKKYVYDG
jgi:hypothetical protein